MSKAHLQSDRPTERKGDDPMSKTKPQMYRFNNMSRCFTHDTEGFYEHELMNELRNKDAVYEIAKRLTATEYI